MKLTAPPKTVFWVALGIAVLGVLSKIVPALWQLGIAGWLGLIAFLVLAAGNLYAGFQPTTPASSATPTQPRGGAPKQAGKSSRRRK